MSELVSKSEFIAATPLGKLKLGGAAGPLMKITGLTRFNHLYEALEGLEGLAFIEAFFQVMEIECQFEAEELARIPASGPFITVSNHPFGLLDGMLLLKLIGQRRPDYRVMANFLLQHVAPLRDNFFVHDPKVDDPDGVLYPLQAGSPLGMFPAGEVSTLQPGSRTVSDRAWQPQALKLIKKAGVPVVPVYFQGGNSALFHIMGLFHPSLRSVALPSEALRKRHAQIRVRIGSPIPVKDQERLGSADRLGRYLRARTYSMGSPLAVHKFYARKSLSRSQLPEPIAAPVAADLLHDEILRLEPGQHLLCSQGEFDVYLAEARQIPHLLNEIGRCREETFRLVGEGTQRALDLDEYDLYYKHLLLWDREAKAVAGAYRIGRGDEIMSRYGKKGFYTHSLFNMQDGLAPVLEKAIELGRSWVLPEYQRKRLPLFLLWKGITEFLARNQHFRYLMGPVTISNDYSALSKSFIVAFIRKYYYDDRLAALVKPRKRFRPKAKLIEVETLVELTDNDLKRVDEVLADIEPAHFRLPVLLKKYIKQNARILGFNIDPLFNEALDGFMLLDLKDLPEATWHTVAGKVTEVAEMAD